MSFKVVFTHLGISPRLDFIRIAIHLAHPAETMASLHRYSRRIGSREESTHSVPKVANLMEEPMYLTGMLSRRISLAVPAFAAWTAIGTSLVKWRHLRFANSTHPATGPSSTTCGAWDQPARVAPARLGRGQVRPAGRQHRRDTAWYGFLGGSQ